MEDNPKMFKLNYGLLIGILGVLIAIFSIIYSTKDKSPVYTVSNPNLIAQTIQGENNLKITWNGENINNVASVTVAIWNKGRQYIDKSDISTDDPIQVVPSDHNSKILAVYVLKTSRPNLNFDTNINSNKSGYDYVIINIEGDEALEYMDGLVLHILYTGSINNTWDVTGRIKGVPNGIVKQNNVTLNKTNLPPFEALFFPFFTIVGVCALIYKAKRFKIIDAGTLILTIMSFAAVCYSLYLQHSVIPIWLR
jgi:hypothetical protein